MDEEFGSPVLVLKNVFNVRDTTSKPVVDIISIYGKREPLPHSNWYTAERVCIYVNYKGDTSVFSFRWVHAEGICSASLYPPGNPKNMCEKNKKLTVDNGKRVRTRRNFQINDIFLNKEYSDRLECHMIPCVSGNQFAIFFQLFDILYHAPDHRPFLTLLSFDLRDDHIHLNKEHFENIHDFSIKRPKIFREIHFLTDL